MSLRPAFELSTLTIKFREKNKVLSIILLSTWSRPHFYGTFSTFSFVHVLLCFVRVPTFAVTTNTRLVSFGFSNSTKALVGSVVSPTITLGRVTHRQTHGRQKHSYRGGHCIYNIGFVLSPSLESGQWTEGKKYRFDGHLVTVFAKTSWRLSVMCCFQGRSEEQEAQ